VKCELASVTWKKWLICFGCRILKTCNRVSCGSRSWFVESIECGDLAADQTRSEVCKMINRSEESLQTERNGGQRASWFVLQLAYQRSTPRWLQCVVVFVSFSLAGSARHSWRHKCMKNSRGQCDRLVTCSQSARTLPSSLCDSCAKLYAWLQSKIFLRHLFARLV